MHLIVGLGNPGGKYAGNRHNGGFMALDAIAEDWRLGPWKSRFSGQTAEGVVETGQGPKKVLLLKPQTFYNESGRAVAEAARFYKIEADKIMVFHDELDLAPGKFRLKTGGELQVDTYPNCNGTGSRNWGTITGLDFSTFPTGWQHLAVVTGTCFRFGLRICCVVRARVR